MHHNHSFRYSCPRQRETSKPRTSHALAVCVPTKRLSRSTYNVSKGQETRTSSKSEPLSGWITVELQPRYLVDSRLPRGAA